MGLGSFFAFIVSTPLSGCPQSPIFSVVRALVRFWRIHAIRITVYLDDDLGSARAFAPCEVASFTSVVFPMRVNLFGSPLPVWYGWVFVLICLVTIFPFPQRGFLVLNLFSTLSVLNTHFLLLGKWPLLWGRLFPWALCLGISPYLDQIFPYRYLRSSGWDSRISLSASILRELCFWQENIPFLNSRCVVSLHRHYSGVCYSDASSTGCASVTFWNSIIPFLIRCGMLRRLGRTPLSESSRLLLWVWSLLALG